MGEDIRLWDEFHPNLYTLTATMGKESISTTSGMSEISIEGRQFYMNGKKIWMRGTVGNCCFLRRVIRQPMRLRGSVSSRNARNMDSI